MNSFISTAIDMGTTTQTENGDKTYSTSLNACVDLFFQIAAIRGQPDSRVHQLFGNAFAEDPKLATKIALWARDIRGGAGERETFRHVLRYLETYHNHVLDKILHLVPVVGRWDDLFVFTSPRIKENVSKLIWSAITREKNGLATKWCPRQGPIAKQLRDAWGLSPKQYRKLLVSLTNVVETKMCAKEWDKIIYEHVPSVASARYAKAFRRHDETRYQSYLDAVKKGEKKINTVALYPYDVTKSSVDPAAADTLWNNLPDYVREGISFIPLIDVSGSMTSPAGGTGKLQCMDVSISLGIYLAERNKSVFKNLAVTFTTDAKIFKIPGGSIRDKVQAVRGMSWGGSTNLDAAMNTILNVALKGNVPQKDMPTHLIVLSDMEFNSNSNYNYHTRKYEKVSVAERTRESFKQAGYQMPNIIWWNIQSRHGSTPVRASEDGMALVSGFSPSIMKSILANDMNPVSQMLATVDIERYDH